MALVTAPLPPLLLLLLLLLHWPAPAPADVSPGGVLYPRESETRDVRSLDGIWNFRLASETDPLAGFTHKWFDSDLAQTGETIPMPVPSSYNDVTQEKSVRDHLGLVWYDRTFYVPDAWREKKSRVWLRFGSVNYAAQVWVNGQLAVVHEIGHLPFQAEITPAVKFGAKNRVTVVVDNTLLQTTVPQGRIDSIDTDNGTRAVQSYTFDFFNYAGIHRPVHLYTTPAIFIDDISVNTDIEGDLGVVFYNISYGGYIQPASEPTCYVDLLDKDGNIVVADNGQGDLQGRLDVPNAKLWWPYLMHENPGYLYTLQVRLKSNEWGTEDVYRLPIGIRKLEWNETSFLINSKPIYLRGFGRHEDSDIRGKGLDYPLIIKDYNLIKWIGANSYRTSHYPYAEEIMDQADQQGILIIDECPSVDTEYIVEYVKSLDTTRPVTMATARGFSEDKAARFMDIIGFNRYNGWYSNPGKIDTIKKNVQLEAESWFFKFRKPIFMTEYGADTMPGLHFDPDYIWSEEYQIALMSEHFKAFDALREQGFFIGEMIWNFADFKTAQTYTRVGGNKKGIFTRDRQPKSSAHHLRRRYWALSEEIEGTTRQTVDNYIISSQTLDKTEL
ncbi:Beta-glucuronidase [Gryllus bimaculatus]|nr:Beta-glucuronidase [Gryllus bimaculatus]